jgi:hypothetical protein
VQRIKPHITHYILQQYWTIWHDIKNWYCTLGCLPRLTKSVPDFSLALGGLIGGNRRVGVVDHCRLNLSVRWQSSSLSSRWNSSFMLFLNPSRRLSIVYRQQSKGNEGRAPRAALRLMGAGSDGQFETQDFPSQCQSVRAATGSVRPSSAIWCWHCAQSRINKAFWYAK